MKSILFLILMGFFGILWGDELTDVKTFFEKVGQEKAKIISSILDSDEHFKKGYAFLTDPSKMHKNVINKYYKNKDKNESKEITLPRYDKAVEAFEASVLKHKNPLSAYLGLKCLNFLPNLNSIENIKRKKVFSEALYKETKLCKGYIEYATVLMQGIGMPVDLNKALEVIRKGKKECFTKADDWEKSIIDVKETQILFKLKKKS